MPIPHLPQPETIMINDALRLRKFDGIDDFALPWYQDPTLVLLVDGVRTPYDEAKLHRMYDYLDRRGELYFIEIKENGGFDPIGDVTLCRDDLPIVIGRANCRGRGLGTKVLSCLLRRAQTLGFPAAYVKEIYDFNAASIACFQGLGFVPYEKTEKGRRYKKEFSAT